MKLSPYANVAMLNLTPTLNLLCDKRFVFYKPSKFSCQNVHFGETPNLKFEEESKSADFFETSQTY